MFGPAIAVPPAHNRCTVRILIPAWGNCCLRHAESLAAASDTGYSGHRPFRTSALTARHRRHPATNASRGSASTDSQGAEHALIGTMEHGVLGKRWAYDGCHDPVLVTELLSLIEGNAPAMAQSITDTRDHEVTRSHSGAPFDLDGFTPKPTDDRDGTRLPVPGGTILHVHRALASVDEHPPLPRQGALGHVATGWQGPNSTRPQAVLMTLLDA
ncbi:maltokinase N-terminal cap-like domain-containing protein [Streptomyces sp. YGL11-2]|uniref:maltokinase N-terminal cap-like domain-containing protein n=1 Tax=Streptomyces sp. YGL11-2 TaxID=3414028 RepID=UPI003CE7E730